MPLTPANISRHDIEQFKEVDLTADSAAAAAVAKRFREVAAILKTARVDAEEAKDHADKVRDQLKAILIEAKVSRVIGPDFKITWSGSERAGALDTDKLDAFLQAHGTRLEAFRGPPSDINTVLVTFKNGTAKGGAK
jgi:hypothetical protein